MYMNNYSNKVIALFIVITMLFSNIANVCAIEMDIQFITSSDSYSLHTGEAFNLDSAVNVKNGAKNIDRLSPDHISMPNYSIDEKSFSEDYSEFQMVEQVDASNENSMSLMSSLPNGGPYTIVGTNILMYWNNGTVTFKGSGTIPYGMQQYADSVTAVVVSEKVVVGDGAFANMYKLKAVTLNGTATTIGNDAFYGCKALQSITVPNTIKTIGNTAFMNCTDLQNVTIGTGVTKIPYGAFYNCTSLKTVTLPSNVTSLEEASFGLCSNLSSVTMTSVKTIGAGAFDNCDKLTSISFGNSLESIGDGAFYSCSSLMQLELPETVNKIGEKCFMFCDELQTVNIKSCSDLGAYAFAECDKLKSVTLPSNLNCIPDYAFFYCISLENIAIPDSVDSIGYAAFYYCESLNSITFPENYIDVGAYAFSFCNKATAENETVKLKNVGLQAFIGTSIFNNIEFSGETTKIDDAAFQGNTNLKSINFNNATLSAGENAFFDCTKLNEINNHPIFLSVGKVAFYECSGITEATFSEECSLIGYGAFYKCENLNTIGFSDCSAKIEDGAFYECTSLTDVTISKNCTGFGVGCFYGCSALKTINLSNVALPISDHMFTHATNLETIEGQSNISSIGQYSFYGTKITEVTGFASVKSLGEAAFANCTTLQKIEFPASVTEIPQAAFMECKSLNNITIPDNITLIGSGAFAECDSLESITIPDSVSEISMYAFSHCDNLESVYGLKNVRTIGENAFIYCVNLKSISLTDKIETIGNYAFCECNNLNSIGDMSGVSSIGEAAFYNCSSLKSLEFSSKLDSVEKYAFEFCAGLETVKFADGITIFEDEIFAGCTNLYSVDIPGSVTAIKENVFWECDSLTNISLPENLISLGVGAFYSCDNLSQISIPDSVNQIGYSCFYECKSLKNAKLPQNIDIISKGMFYGCTNLEAITMPVSSVEVELSAFFGCEKLKSINLPENLRIIGDNAFAYCKNLSTIKIPDTVKTVGEYAFAYCDSIENMEIPRNVSTINAYTFYCCPKLTEVKYMGDVLGVGTAAFYDCTELKSVSFYGKTPSIVGDKSFFNTSNDLVLYGSSLNEEWTSPEWTGPDGNTYKTDVIYPQLKGDCGDNVKWEYFPESALLIISGEGSMDDYENSSDVPWYNYIADITTIHIKNGVTHIGDRAFSDSSALKSVIMENSVTSCGVYSFAKCDNLVYVKLSDNLDVLGDYAFYSCISLAEVKLPAKIQEIGSYTFFGCNSMGAVSLPNSIVNLGEGAFYNCTGIKNVVLSSQITKVNDYTFSGCINLENIFLPDNIEAIGKSAFSGCTALLSVHILGENIYIDDYAFSGCSNLKNIYFSSTEPEYLGYNSLVNLPSDAVAYYSDNGWTLDNLTAKDGRSIACEANTLKYSGFCGNGVNWTYYGNGILLINGNGAINDYEESNTPWEEYKSELKHVIISDGITSVGGNAFRNCNKLESVDLGENIESIGECAFADCDMLKHIDFSEELSSIGKNAFYHCFSLLSIEIPPSVETINDYAFALCSSLNNVELNSGLNKIGYSAFYACDNLLEISVPSSVDEISDWAFARCAKMMKVNLPDNILIGEYAFFGCEALSDFTIPESMTEISPYMLAGTAVKEISLPDNIKIIREGAFWGCDELTMISLNNVEIIENSAFFESGLTAVEIPEKTTAIGEYAFGMCNNLTEISVDKSNSNYCDMEDVLYNKSGTTLIQYPSGKSAERYGVDENTIEISTGAFYGSDISEVSIPRTVTSLGEAAFANCENLSYVTLPDDLYFIDTGTFYGCSALEGVEFLGDAPSVISEDAFSGTSEKMLFTYTEGKNGWTNGEWTGPDGLIYSTIAKEPSDGDLRLYSVIFDETNNQITYSLNITNNQPDSQEVEFWVAIYDKNGKLLTLKNTKETLEANTIYDTSFVISGKEINSKTIVKAFLWHDQIMKPLSKNLFITNKYDIQGEGNLEITFGEFIVTCEPLPPVAPDVYSIEQVTSDDIMLMSVEDTADNTYSVDMNINCADLLDMTKNATASNIRGIDLMITSGYSEKETTNTYSTKVDIADYDEKYGYTSNGIEVQDKGHSQNVVVSHRSWMPHSYADSRISSSNRILSNVDKSELSEYELAISENQHNTIDFKTNSKRLFSLTETGFAYLDGETYSKLEENGTYHIIVPFEGNNLLFNIDTNELINAVVNSHSFSEFVGDEVENVNVFNISLNVTNENEESSVLFDLQLLTDEVNKKVIDVSVLDYAKYEGKVNDYTYNPLDYDVSIDATEDMPLTVNAVSPKKASNGTVTIRLDGTMLEAGAKVYLVKGDTQIEAKEMYYFDHTKLYATFDLSKAANGVYDVKIVQKDKETVCPECFTVDSSLPKGKLTSKINVDKKATVDKEYNGSITYTNTGYTDVYAPVILIDCGNIELQSVDSDNWFKQEVVFVENQSGLAGIIANGETATYNFKYKLKDKGFSINVYNYADITENVTEDIKLTSKSTPTDILKYNINKLTGVRANDYAASIAKMASYQSSIGEDCTDINDLRNAYLVDAQGTLALDTIASSTDIVSRELSFERCFTADITLHQKEGLFGQGWISTYDITAELIEGESSESENVIVITKGSNIELFTLKDGVYTERFYGLSTAEVTDEGIAVHSENDSLYQFNGDGKLAKICDVYGNYIELSYSTDKKLSEVTTNNGDRLIFTYTDGKVSSIESAITGGRVEYSYTNNLLTSCSGEYGTVFYQYDIYGIGGRKNSLNKILFSDGAYLEFDYDELGRVIATRNNYGATKVSYPGGNRLEVIDINGDTIKAQYDTGGILKRTVDGSGSMLENVHSDKLLNTSVKLGVLNEIKCDYDENYNLTGVTDLSGNKTSYSYDGKGRLTNVTDRQGISTEYNRNSMGDLQSLVYADGRFESFEYDEKGNVISAVKRDGTQVSYSYNDISQLVEVNYSTGQYIKYTYDEKGNIIIIDENGARTIMEYNERGDLKSIAYPGYSNVEYTYDEFGNVTNILANYGSISREHSYKYDEFGRLITVGWFGLDMASYEYNPDGSLKKETGYNGSYTDYEYEYGMLKSIKNYNADSTLLSFFEYTYDELGNISSVKENSGTWSYGYDKSGQLTRATSPTGETTVYTYDLSGNRTSVVTKDGVVNYNSNEMNQYTSYGSTTRKYDVNGNLISQTDETGTTTYEYDYMDRLSKVTMPDGKIISYTYDVFGNRSSINEDGVLTEFINTPTGYGYALASIRNNQLESDYIQGNGMAGRVIYNPQTAELNYYDYSYNHLGSTSEITDEAGNVVNSYTYDQEGKIIARTEEIENPFNYVGKYGITDDNNGLYYARARFISADTMSFISPDPIGQNADLNLYRYAGNNVVSCVDLSGKYAMALGAGMGLALRFFGVVALVYIVYHADEIGEGFSFVGNTIVKGAVKVKEDAGNMFYDGISVGAGTSGGLSNFHKGGNGGPGGGGPGGDPGPDGGDPGPRGPGGGGPGGGRGPKKGNDESIFGKGKEIIGDTFEKMTGGAAPIELPQSDVILNVPSKNYIANNIYSATDNSINGMSVITLNAKVTNPVYSTNAGLEYFMQKNGGAYNDGQNIWMSNGLGKITITPIETNYIGGAFDSFVSVIQALGRGFVAIYSFFRGIW